MAKPGSETGLLLSTLDRLIDREPRATAEAQGYRSGRLSEMKQAVKRDLQWLLNTRRTIVEIPAGLDHLAESVFVFGLPDFTHAALSTPLGKESLLRVVEGAIRKFEPRLINVVVTPLEGRPSDRGLRFRIDAVLDVKPTPEAVAFDSMLQMPTNAFVMEGD